MGVSFPDRRGVSLRIFASLRVGAVFPAPVFYGRGDSEWLFARSLFERSFVPEACRFPFASFFRFFWHSAACPVSGVARRAVPLWVRRWSPSSRDFSRSQRGEGGAGCGSAGELAAGPARRLSLAWSALRRVGCGIQLQLGRGGAEDCLAGRAKVKY